MTTILDFSHCVNTPEHADAAVQGLVGRRWAARSSPTATSRPRVPSRRSRPPEDRIRDAHRVRERHFSCPTRLTMGVALTETGLLPFAATRAEIASAQGLDALLTAHTGSSGARRSAWECARWRLHGLLGPGQVHVHCNALSDEELGML